MIVLSVEEGNAFANQDFRWETMMVFFSARGAANFDAKTVFAATFLEVAALV